MWLLPRRLGSHQYCGMQTSFLPVSVGQQGTVCSSSLCCFSSGSPTSTRTLWLSGLFANVSTCQRIGQAALLEYRFEEMRWHFFKSVFTDCNYLHTVVKVIQSIGTWLSVSEVKLGLWPHLKWRSDPFENSLEDDNVSSDTMSPINCYNRAKKCGITVIYKWDWPGVGGVALTASWLRSCQLSFVVHWHDGATDNLYSHTQATKWQDNKQCELH